MSKYRKICTWEPSSQVDFLKRFSWEKCAQEIEEFLGKEIYLELSVKVQEGWRKDIDQLKRLGYE